MQESARKARNSQRLNELYPWFATKLALVIKDLEDDKLRPRIQDAWRSPEDQLIAFNSGHSKLKFGFHNVTGPGGRKESLAVDLLDDNFPLKIGTPYILKVTAIAERYGLTTGVRWGLPPKLAKAIDQAIETQNWKANVKVGWDPVHVEPAGFTVDQAAAGLRPDTV